MVRVVQELIFIDRLPFINNRVELTETILKSKTDNFKKFNSLIKILLLTGQLIFNL